MTVLVLVCCDTKVDEFETRRFVRGIEDIIWFDVSVTNSLAMQIIASFQQCLHDLRNELFRKAAELVQLTS